MKKQLVLSGLIMAISFGSAAHAQDKSVLEDFYVKSNDSVVADENLSFGYRPLSTKGLLNKARFEQELSHSVSIFEENSQDKTKIMSNLLYDFERRGSIAQYLGAGLGVTHISVFDKATKTDVIPTYQIMTGLSYKSEKHPSIKVHMGYNYSDALGSESAGNDLNLKQGKRNNGNHAVAAFVKFDF